MCVCVWCAGGSHDSHHFPCPFLVTSQAVSSNSAQNLFFYSLCACAYFCATQFFAAYAYALCITIYLQSLRLPILLCNTVLCSFCACAYFCVSQFFAVLAHAHTFVQQSPLQLCVCAVQHNLFAVFAHVNTFEHHNLFAAFAHVNTFEHHNYLKSLLMRILLSITIYLQFLHMRILLCITLFCNLCV